MEKVNILK